MRGCPIVSDDATKLGTCTRTSLYLPLALHQWLGQNILQRKTPLSRGVRDLHRPMLDHQRPPSRTVDQARKLFVPHSLTSPDLVWLRKLQPSRWLFLPLLALLLSLIDCYHSTSNSICIFAPSFVLPSISCTLAPSPPTFTTTPPSILDIPRFVPSS